MDQNAKEIRKYVERNDLILEHHSNVFSRLEENGEEIEKYQMRTERWDMPVIATTLVQFLNALFDGKSSSV